MDECEALELAGVFIGVAAAAWIFGGLQGGVFAIVGERLTTRLRVHLFRSILRQEASHLSTSPLIFSST